MHRSSSWTRVSDVYNNSSSSSSKVGVARLMSSLSAGHDEELPLYGASIAEMAKKERASQRLAENAVHFIPLILILCALLLWLFSTTPGTGMGGNGQAIAAIIEGLSMDGDVDYIDVTQTGVIPTTVDHLRVDAPRRIHNHKHKANSRD